jgi:hypothetical protein
MPCPISNLVAEPRVTVFAKFPKLDLMLVAPVGVRGLSLCSFGYAQDRFRLTSSGLVDPLYFQLFGKPLVQLGRHALQGFFAVGEGGGADILTWLSEGITCASSVAVVT